VILNIWEDSEWARILAFQALKTHHDARAECLKAKHSHRLYSEYGAFLQEQRKMKEQEDKASDDRK
jgi:hypothetical protein